jgi:DNA-binding transcriptional regulator YdaS (Cro superfamily)
LQYNEGMKDTALQEAISKAGGVRALAASLKITPQAISKWRKCPALRVLSVARLTGVPKERLRPDVFIG